MPRGAADIDPLRPFRCETSRGWIQCDHTPKGDKRIRVREYGRGDLDLCIHPWDYWSNLKVIAVIMALSHHPSARNI